MNARIKKLKQHFFRFLKDNDMFRQFLFNFSHSYVWRNTCCYHLDDYIEYAFKHKIVTDLISGAFSWNETDYCEEYALLSYHWNVYWADYCIEILKNK